MPNIRPVSDLRNYNDILREIPVAVPVNLCTRILRHKPCREHCAVVYYLRRDVICFQYSENVRVLLAYGEDYPIFLFFPFPSMPHRT